jgi:hypothetical protein
VSNVVNCRTLPCYQAAEIDVNKPVEATETLEDGMKGYAAPRIAHLPVLPDSQRRAAKTLMFSA